MILSYHYEVTMNKKNITKPNIEESILPISYYIFDYSNGFSGFQFHWHDEIELHYIIKGSGQFFIHDTEYEVAEGDIVYISPKLIHSGKSINNDLVAICYVISCDYLLSRSRENNTDKFITALLKNKISYPVIGKAKYGYDNIKNSLEIIDKCVTEKDLFFQLEIKKQLYELLITLYKCGYLNIDEKNDTASQGNKIIKKSISYIQQNSGNPLSIEKIASNVGLSPSYFMKIFKQYTKMTCVEYINSFRLNNAITMLRETDESILQIANTCGYRNLSLFNREFKKYYNTTPSKYRKKYTIL